MPLTAPFTNFYDEAPPAAVLRVRGAYKAFVMTSLPADLPSNRENTADKRLPTKGSTSFSPQVIRDFRLIERILAHQEQKAYTELLDHYQRPVYHLVLRMVAQAEIAEDLTLEVLMRACHHLPSFQPTYSFSSWLFRMATNYCIDYLRRRRLPTVSLSAELATANGKPYFPSFPDAAPTPQDALIRTQRHEHLRQAVAQLPAPYKHLVEMHYFQELSYEEIATQQHMPLGTVKGHLHQGRKLLAQQLAGTLMNS
jgi:RNA polymerase sigma factor (sigma-70 family)